MNQQEEVSDQEVLCVIFASTSDNFHGITNHPWLVLNECKKFHNSYLWQCEIVEGYSIEWFSMQPRIRNSAYVVLWRMWFKYWNSKWNLLWFRPSHSFSQCEKLWMVNVIILWILIIKWKANLLLSCIWLLL